MKENHEMWVAKIKEEEQQKALSEKLESIQQQVCIMLLPYFFGYKTEFFFPSKTIPKI